MIINDLDGYYIVFDTKNWNTELDTLSFYSIPISPSEDELPPDEEPPLEEEPESDEEPPPPLGVLLPESAEELPEVEGVEDF